VRLEAFTRTCGDPRWNDCARPFPRVIWHAEVRCFEPRRALMVPSCKGLTRETLIQFRNSVRDA